MSKRRNPRRSSLLASSRQLRHETLERRQLLAADFGDILQQPQRAGDPMLIAVSPNNGELLDLDPQDMSANRRLIAPKSMHIFIGGDQALDPSTFRDAFKLQYQREGNFGAFNVEDVVIGVIDADDSGRGLAIRFADNLKDGFYQLSITTELLDTTGVSYVPRSPVPVPGDLTGLLRRDVISFEVETGAKVTAVVPQPLNGGVPALDTIDVYFNDSDLFDTGSTVGDTNFYQLIDTKNTVTTEDDVIHNPQSVTEDAASRRVSLLFNSDLGLLVGDLGDSLRLRVGDDDTVAGANAEVVHESVSGDPGLLAADAHQIISVNPLDERWAFKLEQTIDNVGSGLAPMVDNPGGINEPGHRDIEFGTDSHYLDHGARDSDNQVVELPYTFLRDQPYGVNSQGHPVYNEMDADQEQRFREILEVYGEVMGVDFVETESEGLKLLVGDLGIATSDFFSGPGGTAGVGGPGQVIMDAVDFQNPQANVFGGSFFNVAVHEIGHAMSLGHAYDLPPGTTNGGGGLYPGSSELTFPGPADRIHLNYLNQRESLDVDLYKFDVGLDGIVKAQTIAARLAGASRLDTRLTLFRRDVDTGLLELMAANDDFFNSDSYLELAVSPNPDGSPAEYFVGVSAEGNSLFDPDTGLPSPGGSSQGEYELRLDFVADIALTTAITDGSGSVLDGDRDGLAGGNYNFWFEPSIDDAALASIGNTVYVDKDAAAGGDGRLGSPFNDIPMALNAAQSLVSTTNTEGVVVRLLPSAGPDGNVSTVVDNVAYEIGMIASIGQVLEDGRNLHLPGGIHLVVDAGVIMKFLDSRISVGSDNDGFDRSQSSISVQGTPDLPVYFTSYNDPRLGSNSNVLGFDPEAGDWGGIEIRNDVDRDQGRVDLERQGIFQSYINHASFQYGGGEVTSVNRVISPIHLSEARAEVSYNTMELSADAPVSADPNTFEITTFTEPRYQSSRLSGFGFISDYDRVGPVVHGNQLLNNPTNGLFVRIDTPPGGGLETLQVAARFDDTDVVHVMAENFLLEGVPGGLLQDSQQPDPVVGLIAQPAGQLVAGDYTYSYTFVDAFGFESPNSEPQTITLAGPSNVQLTDIPVASGKYQGRRLYRSFNSGPLKLVAELDRTSLDHLDDVAMPAASAAELPVPGTVTVVEDAGPGNLANGTYSYKYTFVDASGIESRYSLAASVSIANNRNVLVTGIQPATGKYVGRVLYRSRGGGPFRLVANLDATATSHVDDNDSAGAIAEPTSIRHSRITSTLVVDPGMIIKSQGSRIELGFGANLLAEGRDGDEIIFTSKTDDRYGASGSFDTDGNGDTRGDKGDWAGFYASPTSRISIDEAFIAYAGGVAGVNGGTASFNAVQVHQAETRITNTRFENNADGTGFNQGDGRMGYAPQDDATVYVNSTQPTLINNVFVDNDGAAISINANAMGHEWKDDGGRQIGALRAFEVSAANNGPVIQGNRLSGNDLNGLEVRGEVLQTASVFDDTDIVHVLDGTVIVPDHHTYGGLRLESSSGEALVVKVLAGGGIEATGRPLDIVDRIGGRVHVIGQPGFPVVMTSINDDSVGAGFTPEGRVQKNTRPGGGVASPGDWAGLSFDPYSNDRNVAVYTEIEGNVGGFGDANATLGVEETVGLLAADEKSGDENLRLGFKIHGALSADRDVDLYSFEGAAGSTVWIDVDDTDPRLDTVLELLDGAGRVLAVSQNSRQESAAGELAFVNPDLLRDGHALPMQLDHDAAENADGSYRDLFTTNDGDSGMRVYLPGVTGTRNDFFVRVRSNNLDNNIGAFQMSYAGIAPVAVGHEVVGLLSGAKGVVTHVDAGNSTFSYVLKTEMHFSDGEDLTSHPGNSVGSVSSLLTSGATRGSYQLQLRLREVDEFAGSVVRYADLRYATDTIVATGLPAHSPLAAELTHQGGNQYLSDFSNTDRGAVSAAGHLQGLGDQDVYTFQIHRDDAATDGDEAVSVAFDIDWADGLTRPDTAISILRQVGGGYQLIAQGNDSNIADDIITPIVLGQPTTKDDLGRGSQGNRDALVGPMKLAPGSYMLVVNNEGMMDSRLTQFTQFDAPGVDPAAWAATRLQPLNNTETLGLSANYVQFQFGDIPFLIVPPAGNMDVVNPFTGGHDATITTPGRDVYGGVAASEARVNVLAIESSDGTDAGSEKVYILDAEGTQTDFGTTGIQTFRTNGTTNEVHNRGIDFRALAFAGGNDSLLYGLGDRDQFDGAVLDPAATAPTILSSTPVGPTSDLIYRLDPDTGAALSRQGIVMPAGFESANPIDPLLQPPFGLGFDPLTPWAGTNLVPQVQVPEPVVSLVGTPNLLYAFTTSGNVYGYAHNGGDLTQIPIPFAAPTATDGAGTRSLTFASVTRGPEEFGLGDLFFGIEASSNRMYAFTEPAVGGSAEPVMEYGGEFAELGVGYLNSTQADNVAGMFFGHFQTSWTDNELGPKSNPDNADDYDFLGGGHGSVQLDPIDLSSFAAEDLPTFYFDYTLHSDDDVGADSLRVSVAGDDGHWRLVATNNITTDANTVWQSGGSASTQGGSFGGVTEYDPAGSRGYTNVFTQTFVQELFNDSVDRQARIDLGPWAGHENVRIRIDFSTAGEARPDQSEIHLLPGYQIADGHQIILTGDMPDPNAVTNQHDALTNTDVVFEFDHGLVVDLPAGAAITEKVDLRLNGALILTLLPTGPAGPNQIVVSASDSAADVADRVHEELAASFTILRSEFRPSWVQVDGTVDGTATLSGPSLNFTAGHILSEPGVAATSVEIAIGIDSQWTKERVAEEVQSVFADTLFFDDIGPELDSFPLVEGNNGEVGAVRVYDLIVRQPVAVPSHAQPLTMIHGQKVDPKLANPLYELQTGYETDYPGEEFGVYRPGPLTVAGDRSKGLGGQSSSQNPVPTDKQGMSLGNYQFGLAERGESVVSGITTAAGVTLVNDPFFEAKFASSSGVGPVATEVKVGPYQVEVRLGRQTVDANNILFNERLADGYNLQVDSAGSDIVDGDTFTLSNGFETVTFEFNDVTGVSDGVTPGNVAVPYGRTFSQGEMADAIRNAVNLGEVRDVLQLEATSQGGQLVDPSDPVISFHGFAAADNLGGVFFASSNADTGAYSGPVAEKFEHNSLPLAQNLNAGIWSDAGGIPQLIVNGTRADSEVDYYSFNVGSSNVSSSFEVNATGFTPQLFLLRDDGSIITDSGASLSYTFAQQGTYYLAVARTRPAANPLPDTPAIWTPLNPEAPIQFPFIWMGPAGPDGPYELEVSLENKSRHFSSVITGTDVGVGFDNGDRNRFRDQGVFIVDSNVVSFASGDGVTIAAGPTTPGTRVPREGDRPKPGAVQHLPLLNTDNQIYGAVVQNNLLIGNDRGIVLDGNPAMAGPSVYSRLMNNTVFNSTVGIDIRFGASPTLLNNVLIGNGTGIRGQNSGETVLRSTVFSNNGNDVFGVSLGTESQVDPTGPLFVNPDATGFNLAAGRPNFYPAPDSAVIDQSIASQPDRNNLVSIKDVLGIPPSPIVVSDRDLVGQLRENGSSSSGQGQNVNIDIGAIDRSDVTGPLATLMIPGDNDGKGVDIDPANTVLQLKSGVYGYFEILISEGAGIGPDESSIDENRVLLLENRRRLVPDTEVVISYNSANRTLRFQSPAGLWRPDAVYEILLLNEDLSLPDGTMLSPVADLAGNSLQPNRPDGQTRFTIVMPEVGIDFGDAYQSTTGSDYATLRDQDGARHAIIDTYDPTTLEYHLAEPRLGLYVDDDFYNSKSESQVLLADGDDQVANLTVVGNEQDPGSSGPFLIGPAPSGAGIEVQMDLLTTVQQGDNLAISAEHAVIAGSNTLGQNTLVYELVLAGTQASANRIPVVYDAGDSNTDIMGKLAAALDAELSARNFQASVVYTSGNSLILLPHDDEEGVPVGTFQGSQDYFVFGGNPVEDIDDLLTSEVTGFLNPLDDAGTNFDVTVTGSGYLRAWIDFDDDGEFEEHELVVDDEVFNNPAAGVESRTLTVHTPSDATEGRRWMRLRFSQDDEAMPTGLIVGGEAEDYQVDVISLALPEATPDFFVINEDTLLDTNSLIPPEQPIADNDLNLHDEDDVPVDIQFVIGELPEFGTLDLDDFQESGHFTYMPNADFNGVDTFTYRIATQNSRVDNGDFASDFVTVTIDVMPINDKPDASASFVIGEEDVARVIKQSDLLAAADPDNEDPSPFVLPTGSTTLNQRDVDLMNEVNQTFVISGVQGDGGSLITAATPATNGNNVQIVEGGGGILTLTVTDASVGDVFSLAYAGQSATFELLDITSTDPQDGTVSILVDTVNDDENDIAGALEAAINNAFAGSDPAIDIVRTNNVLELSFVAPTVVVTPQGMTFQSPAVDDEVTIAAEPTPGDVVTLELGSDTVEFELVDEGQPATAGRVAVALLPFADMGTDAARASAADSLMRAMNQQFQVRNWGVAAAIDPVADPNRITITETAITAGRALTTIRGEAIALFDHAGALIELYYIGKTDFNRDNNASGIGGDSTNYDEISFVATDDGISIDLHNNRFVYGLPKVADLATADIEIKPRNDVPVVNADGMDDRVAMELSSLDPTDTNDVTLWESYFMNLGEPVPAPMEDTEIVIPSSFLIQNDLRARVSADDENIADPNAADNNDASIRVVDATPGWNTVADGGSLAVDPVTGDVTLVPPTDWYGDIFFTYRVRDEGINEAVDGTRTVTSITSDPLLPGTVTVALQPVNDIPVANDRELRFVESDLDAADVFTFTAGDLNDPVLNAPDPVPGIVGPLPLVANTAHPNSSGLVAPFNEAEQELRVVEFETGAGVVNVEQAILDGEITGMGTESLTLPSDTGGLYEFTFVDAVFVSGTFTATANYNERAPFAPVDIFTYRIADNGQADASLLGQGYGDFDQPDEISSDLSPGTVTISVAETNDAPGFDIPNLTIDILERDDSVGTVIGGFADTILPGPPSAIDEVAHQSVSFTVVLDRSVPNTLIQAAELSPTGDLTIITEPDAVGQATMIVTAIDNEVGNPAFVPRTTVETITINVRPVNDGPRLDPLVVNTSGFNSQDDQWEVGIEDLLGQAPITYTLREDNTQAGGGIQDYSIPVTAGTGPGYQKIGLFDVFTVGPENEANNDGFLPDPPPFDTASLQTLELIDFGVPSDLDSSVLITDRGGVLTPVVDGGTGLITELLYTPPLDYNELIGGFDSFAYTVQDNNSAGGETYDLGTQDLVDDRLTRTNRVFLNLNPVNDRPVFTPETTEVVVLEDSAEFTRPNFAINILGGPLLTAFDEHSEDVVFSVEMVGRPAFVDPNGPVSAFFSIAPTIDADTGVLNFKPAPDVFGAFEFEVLLTDNGLADITRGDLRSSIPLTMTIDIRPVNDPPTEDNPTDLTYPIREDVSFTIDEATLLAPFTVGPDNEGFNTNGGDQTLRLSPTDFPTDSREGGVVHYVSVGGNILLEYTPRIDFVGEDEFVYTVIDDGESIMLDGTIFEEPRIATKTVTVNVAAVNDLPRFSGATDQQHLENDGMITVPNWVTNVMVGPETALDEVNQELLFVFDPQSGSDDIFLTPPMAEIDRENQTATLSYTLKDDVSGVAVFDVTLVDDGPNDLANEDEWVSDPPRQVTITVTGVNNAPSFDLDVSSVSIAEDSGPFSQPVISNISPGPADEAAQSVSFEIASLTGEEASLFVVLPTISPSGLLQFTTASNQNTVKSGPVTLSVVARDSEGGVSDPVDLTIAVSEVNDPPVAGVDSLPDTNEDQILLVPESALLASISDPDLATNDNEVLQVLLVGASSAFGAQVSLDAVTREITYDPTESLALQSLKPGEFLTDSIRYRAVDAAGAESAIATVTLRVDGINDAPIALDDEIDVSLNGRTVIEVLANDRDVDGAIQVNTVMFDLVPAFGTVSVNSQGIVTYRPFGTLVTNDTFSYSVADDLGARSESALVTVVSNMPPVAVDDLASTYVSEPVLISVLGNDTDTDGSIDDQSVSLRVVPSHGTAVVQPDGQVLYTPVNGFVGTDRFEYVVSDDGGRQSNLGTVDVVVLASRLQNSSNRYDVTGDGLVTALDPLRIINRLELAGAVSIPVQPGDVGPDYFDVSGDGFITVNDALLVTNNLQLGQFGSGEQAPQQLADSSEGPNLLSDDLSSEFDQVEKITKATCLPLLKEEVIDLLAADQEANDEDDENVLNALDAVLADVF